MIIKAIGLLNHHSDTICWSWMSLNKCMGGTHLYANSFESVPESRSQYETGPGLDCTRS
ncbi:hypothetical protein ACS0TY_010288 [Phlomoides rotata]